MSSKKRKSTLFETCIPGELTLSTAQFFDELRKSKVMAFELASTIRPLALTTAQMQAFRKLIDKRNATKDYQTVTINFDAIVVFPLDACPQPILNFSLHVDGTDKEPLDVFAINDLIGELEPFMLRKTGAATFREHLKNMSPKRPAADPPTKPPKPQTE